MRKIILFLFIIGFLFAGFLGFEKIRTVQTKAKIFKHVEQYYTQQEYTLTEILLINLLIKDPDDQQALIWLKKINLERQNQENNTGYLEELITEQSGLLKQNISDVNLLKKILVKIQNLNKPESEFIKQYFSELEGLESYIHNLREENKSQISLVMTTLQRIQSESERERMHLETCLDDQDILQSSLQKLQNETISEIHQIKTTLTEIQEESGQDRMQVDYYRQDLQSIKSMLNKLSDKYANPAAGVLVSVPVGLRDETPAFEEKDLLAYTEKGLEAYKTKDYSRAKYFLAKALEMEKENASLNAIYASTLYAENPQDRSLMKKVILHAQKAVDLDKSCKLAYATLGEIYECNGNPELAISNYLEAIRIDPLDNLLYHRTGKLYFEMEDFVKAEYYFIEGTMINLNSPATYYYLGKMEALQGNTKAAMYYWEQTIKYDENYYMAYLQMGNSLYTSGDYIKAIIHFEQALSMKDDFLTACKVGDCYWQLGEFKKAEKKYCMILDQKEHYLPDEKVLGVKIYQMMARQFFRNKKYKEARKYAGKGIMLDAQELNLYILLGEICRAQQDYKESIYYLKQALKLDKNHQLAKEELATTRIAAGK